MLPHAPDVRRALLTTLALLLTAAASAGQSDAKAQAPERFEKTRDLALAAVEGGTASVTLVLAQRGEVVFARSFGWADKANQVRATPDVPYSLASISKPITGTALMRLVEQGKIDLDRPINDYLGDAPLRGRAGDVSDATVRSVANHTSGLPLHYQFFYADEERAVPPRAETIRRYGHLVSAPGARFQYSNLGFGVLDYIVERAAGVPFGEYMETEVFSPLGIPACALGIPGGPNVASALRYGQDDEVIPFYDFDHPGASAFYCSGRDLAAFGQAQLGFLRDGAQHVLTEESRREMVRPTSEGNARGYGVAWGIQEQEKATLISHSGGMGGVSTSLTLVPEESASLVVLMNSSGPLRELLQTFLHEAFPERFDAPPESPEPQAKAPRWQPAAELVGTWQGRVETYEGDAPLTLDVRAGGKVFATLGTEERRRVRRPTVDANGFLKGTFTGILPSEDVERRAPPSGARLGLDLRLEGNSLRGALMAFTPGDKNKIGNALSHWTSLERVQP